MATIILTESDLARFQRFLERDDASGCLVFHGARSSYGYGRFWVNPRVYFAHRVAYAIANGNAIPVDKPHILHKCDNPPCCNPALPFGVAENKSGRYSSFVQIGGKKLYLGSFDTADEATEVATRRKKKRFHG